MFLNYTTLTALPIHFDALDGGSCVYHASYIVLCERARNQILDEVGFSFEAMRDRGFFLAIAEIKAAYLKPLRARRVQVLSRLLSLSRSCLTVRHAFYERPVDTTELKDTGDAIDKLEGCAFRADYRFVSVRVSNQTRCDLPDDLKAVLARAS